MRERERERKGEMPFQQWDIHTFFKWLDGQSENERKRGRKEREREEDRERKRDRKMKERERERKRSRVLIVEFSLLLFFEMICLCITGMAWVLFSGGKREISPSPE